MNIAITKNRFSVLSWPNINWIEPTAVDVECEFLVYCGPNVELLFHPELLIKFRQNEFCGVLREDESIHTKRPAFPAPLGYPKWYDGFFVLRFGKYAVEFLDLWRQTQDVSAIAWSLGVQPIQYPGEVLKVHCDEGDRAKIVWGME